MYLLKLLMDTCNIFYTTFAKYLFSSLSLDSHNSTLTINFKQNYSWKNNKYVYST